MVRATMDFPVPAKPLSQKIDCLSCLVAELYISWRRSTQVSGRQMGLYCFVYKLKGDLTAYGRRSRRVARDRLLVSNVVLFLSKPRIDRHLILTILPRTRVLVDFLVKPLECIRDSLAMEKQHIDVENAKQRICPILFTLSLTSFRPQNSLLDAELRKRSALKSPNRDSCSSAK